jgi:isopenicillin N synthase-like dioxygenase
MTGIFSSVPIVDLARLSDPAAKNEELPKLRDAIFVVGFLYLTNTGLEVRAKAQRGTRHTQTDLRLEQDIIHQTHEDLPKLFALPVETKEKCNMINSPSFLGYTRLGAETTASKADLREVGLFFSLLGAGAVRWH